MPTRVEIPLDTLIAQIAATRGNVAQIGRNLAYDRHTVQKRIDESAAARRALDDARKTRFDDVVTALYEEAIDKRNIAALIFIAKADPEAKRRGWGERTEIANSLDDDGAPIPFRVVDYRAGLTPTEE